VIFQANNQMVTVTAAISAASPDGHATTIALESVTSNDPGAAADISGASFGTDDRLFQVRAERSTRPLRIYTATYRATDTVTGLSTTATDTVVVPRDQGTAAVAVVLSVLETFFPNSPLIPILRAFLGL
jgi:hypothetical protein